MGDKNIKTIEKDGLILSEDGKKVIGVTNFPYYRSCYS